MQAVQPSVLARLKHGASRPLREGAEAVALPATEGWGSLPALSLVSALGLLLVALADTVARNGAALATPLFWAGLLALFVPIATRLVLAAPSRPERIGLVVVLGLGLYLVKILHGPLFFTGHDELIHSRTAQDIIQHGRLFHHNPMIPTSPFYPGLEIVTSALVNLTGLSVFSAGLIVVGVGKLILVLALFLFYEQVSHSARVAGIAAVIYMANPNFLFFDSSYSYESLALPFAMLGVYTVARLQLTPDGRSGALTVIALLAIATVVITHHMTSYVLVAFLALWTVLTLYRRYRGQAGLAAGSMVAVAMVALAGVVAWMLFVGSRVFSYLSPVLGGALLALIRLVVREESTRQLFTSDAGEVAPLWERATAFASVGLILLGLPFGLLLIWLRYRHSPAALALAGGVLLYPASLALRLTGAGAETSNRTSEFLFLALGFALAIGIVQVRLPGRVGRAYLPFFAAYIAVIFAGQTIVGNSPWTRLPGPYQVGADDRSVESQGFATAEWARAQLGPGNRIVADRTNLLLMGSHGEQRVVTGLSDGIGRGIADLFLSPQIGPGQQRTLARARIRYILVDRRVIGVLPRASFFDPSERRQLPVRPAVLGKFDYAERVSRIFDSGDIVVYDVGALHGTP